MKSHSTNFKFPLIEMEKKAKVLYQCPEVQIVIHNISLCNFIEVFFKVL